MNRVSRALSRTSSVLGLMIVTGLSAPAWAQSTTEEEEQLAREPEPVREAEQPFVAPTPFEERYPLGAWIPLADDPRSGDPYPGVVLDDQEVETSGLNTDSALTNGPFGQRAPLIVPFSWWPGPSQ